MPPPPHSVNKKKRNKEERKREEEENRHRREKKEYKNRIPLSRYGTVKEVSELISFLVSDNGTYITGQNIRIDGGITKSV